MKPIKTAHIVLALSMMMSAVAAKVMTPDHLLMRSLPPLVLSAAVPEQFGEWQLARDTAAQVVNPQVEAQLKKIYAQTLARVYVNRAGERIMLSIAYGGDQSDAMQVHYPEVCYPAQGFQVGSNRRDTLQLGQRKLPVKRLETSANERYEPVTYWTTVGDTVVSGSVDKKMLEMRYGMRGVIPDGLLFRVSSIDRDTGHAFATQDSFIAALAGALVSPSKERIVGAH